MSTKHLEGDFGHSEGEYGRNGDMGMMHFGFVIAAKIATRLYGGRRRAPSP